MTLGRDGAGIGRHQNCRGVAVSVKSRKASKPLSMRAIFWRIWIVGTLGWMTIIGFNVGSTLMVYNDLSTEELRLESKLNKASAGSYDKWKAGFDLRTVTRKRLRARNELIFDGGYMFGPPLAILIISFLVSLVFSEEDEVEEARSV